MQKSFKGLTDVLKFFVILISAISASWAHAAGDFPVQARFFAAMATVDPKDLNTQLDALSMKNVDKASQFGLEVTYPVAKMLDVGLRFSKTMVNNDENPADAATEYTAKLDQSVALLVARVGFLKTPIFRADVFAGVGGSNTSLKINTATQVGELSKKESGDWFASPCFAYGVSAAAGYKNFYFFLEVGMQNNSVSGLKMDGTLSGNTALIDKIDLSGPYFAAGFLFDGLTGSSK